MLSFNKARSLGKKKSKVPPILDLRLLLRSPTFKYSLSSQDSTYKERLRLGLIQILAAVDVLDSTSRQYQEGRRSFRKCVISNFDNKQINELFLRFLGSQAGGMPSYNLPSYPAPLAVPPSLRSQKLPVSSLTTISSKEQAIDSNTFTPYSPPLPILQQASFTLRSGTKPVYTPSSLSPLTWRPRISESKETTSNISPTLSLRYLSPPNFYSPAAIQQIRLPPFPFIPRTKLQVDRFYEETIASTLGRRLRDKCMRCKIGEKAGMGVRAGREMRLLAALGSCRERKERSERGL